MQSEAHNEHLFSFSWVALIRREVSDVKGWIPGLVSKNTNFAQLARLSNCKKKGGGGTVIKGDCKAFVFWGCWIENKLIKWREDPSEN